MHLGQRLLRDAGRGARGQSRRRALPGDVRGRAATTAWSRRCRPVGRQRRHRERAELAPPDVPDRRRRLVRPPPARHSRLPAGARPSPRGAHPCRVVRDPAGRIARGSAATRRHGASARGGAGDHDRGRELVRADRAALRPRRHGDQLRGRRYRGLGGDHLVPVDQSDPGRRRDLPAGADTASRASSSPRPPARGWTPAARPPPGDRGTGIRRPELALECSARASRLTVEKVVALHTSRDPAISEAGWPPATVDDGGRLRRAAGPHVLAWDLLWGRFDLPLAGQRQAELALRVHLFHLLQTVSPSTIGLDCGVPARGCTARPTGGMSSGTSCSSSPCSTCGSRC